MSEGLEQVIKRAVSDEAFRNMLLDNPEEALRGYNLTDEERDMLRDLDEEKLDEFAGGLGDRLTKGRWIHGTG